MVRGSRRTLSRGAMLLASLALAAGCHRHEQPPARDREILEAMNRFDDAFQRGDRARLDRLVAADYTLTNEDGLITWQKRDMIDAVTAVRVHWLRSTDVRVRDYGSVAMTKRRRTWEVSALGRRRLQDYYITEFWTRTTDGRWLLTAQHGTRPRGAEAPRPAAAPDASMPPSEPRPVPRGPDGPLSETLDGGLDAPRDSDDSSVSVAPTTPVPSPPRRVIRSRR